MEGRGSDCRPELDVAEMGGEGVESVENVRGVEDRGAAGETFFNEEGEET